MRNAQEQLTARVEQCMEMKKLNAAQACKDLKVDPARYYNAKAYLKRHSRTTNAKARKMPVAKDTSIHVTLTLGGKPVQLRGSADTVTAIIKAMLT